jgi:hypothetical protein
MSKFIVKSNQSSLPPKLDVKEEVLTSSLSVQRLIDDCLLALSREVRNLTIASAKGKLEASEARDLRDHCKLLFELKKIEQESLRNLTDDELKAAAKEAMDEN